MIHLVTMKKTGRKSSYEISRSCLRALVAFCGEKGIKTVALPALGTGVGRLFPSVVAEIFVEELADGTDTHFIATDLDPTYIDKINELLERKRLNRQNEA